MGNGSLGIIEGISLAGRKPFVMVRLLENGLIHKVYMKKFASMVAQLEDGKLKYVEGPSFTQFPFMLAWAVTVHKAQGKTFDRVVIDLTEKAFDYGQLYVALSRCTTAKGTILRQRITRGEIMVHDRVREFYAELAPGK